MHVSPDSTTCSKVCVSLEVLVMALDHENATIFAAIVLGINFFVYLPIGLYFSVRFWRLRGNAMIAQRRPFLVMMTIIFIYLWMLISRTINVADVIFGLLPSIYYVHLAIGAGWFCVALYGVRMWLLFYDYKRGEHLSAIRWKTKIDSASTPWTIKYKSSANLVYLIGFAFLHWLFVEGIGLLSMIMILHSNNNMTRTYISCIT